MKLTIDNLDGNGAIDYTPALTSKTPLRIQRQLNAPTLCSFSLATVGLSLPAPLRFGRVFVSDDTGVVLFTGYVAATPALEIAGEGFSGPAYEVVVSAVSDDVLLDMQGVPMMTDSFAAMAGVSAQTLTAIVDPVRFSVNAALASGLVGRFTANPGESWSQNVGQLASSSRNAYKVVSGSVTMTPVGSVTHTLSETEGTLQVNRLQASMVKMLANDVTVCGQEEPSAYVTEVFEGDGVTTLFDLTEDPFFPPSSKTKPLTDLFQTPSINPQMWQVQDPGAHLSLTANGLSCTGGNGIDGQTTLSALTNFELGGSLVIEASGVLLSGSSAGILSGLYTGAVTAAECIAGFQVSQVNGSTVMTPVVNGQAAGTPFSPAADHMYTLRTRLYGKEMQRILQAYYSIGDKGTEMWGGTVVPCPANLILELQDTTNGVSQPPVLLYEGTLPVAPPVGIFALINSENLLCSIRSIAITQEGPVWVASIPPGGNLATRKIGTTAQGADCKIERTGKLSFYSTYVPQSGEQVFVSYRTQRRAVARKANAVSISSQGSAEIPSTARWLGTVTTPKAMSSADCENAATALLNLSSSRAASWEGTYVGWNFETQGDIWPGDVLAVDATSADLTANLVVRDVQIDVSYAVPQLIKYTIRFANDWADALAIKATSTVPSDTWLPTQPEAVEPLQNLLTLTATSVSGTEIQVSAGLAPPTGGGFEVRRRDWSFGPGTDSNLVLRSPVSNFSIPREAVMEQYYVRMYDGSTPPNYSRFSSAIFVNVAL